MANFSVTTGRDGSRYFGGNNSGIFSVTQYTCSMDTFVRIISMGYSISSAVFHCVPYARDSASFFYPLPKQIFLLEKF